MNVDLFYIVPMVSLLFTFAMIFIYGKRKNVYSTKKSLVRFIPLFFVIALIFGILIVYHYYNEKTAEFQKEISKLQADRLTQISNVEKGVQKNQSVDSLLKINKQIEDLLNNIKKQERITGKVTNINQKSNKKTYQLDSTIKIDN